MPKPELDAMVEEVGRIPRCVRNRKRIHDLGNEWHWWKWQFVNKRLEHPIDPPIKKIGLETLNKRLDPYSPIPIQYWSLNRAWFLAAGGK